MVALRYVDPRTLYVSSQRPYADPAKLQRQIAAFGRSVDTMPPIWAEEDPVGRLRILNGMTRATRAAKLAPGSPVPVLVVARLAKPLRSLVTVQDVLP